MSGWGDVLLWWIAFAGWHLALSSSRLRPRLIRRLGGRGFQAVYSAGALASFLMLVTSYAGAKHDGALLWSLAAVPGVRATSIAITAVALTLAIASQFERRPTDLVPGAAPTARGFSRITRHPGFMFFGLLGLSHCLVNGFASDVIFFGGFAVWAVVGCAHLDARKRNADPALEPYFAETSLVPFVAIARGRNRLVPGELPRVGLLAGALVTALLFTFHSSLFGP